MKKIFVVAQFILLAILCAWGLYYLLLRPVEKPVYDHDKWQSWSGFYALSYQGVSKKEGAEYVSAKQLAEHLKALKEAGFHTIAPEDAATFLSGKKPLPEKALLLLFEGGRKDSLIFATPPLQKNRFIGVMCVPTKLTERWESFYLDNRELKSLSKNPNWRLCSMGHRAVDLIPIDGAAAKGHFLTSFMWTAGGKESNDGFVARVQKDYAESAKILEKALGKPVDAYLYPFADRGTTDGPQSLAATTNLGSLKQHHTIAFTRADNPFNTRRGNPYDLNRLRVPQNWDAKKLIGELTKYAPREKVLEGTLNSSDWIVADGTKINQKTVGVSPDTVAWLRGTDDWQNIDMKATVTLSENATAFFYGRYAGPHSYLRLSISKAGLRLQERMGTTMQTLADYPVTTDMAKPHVFGLRIKGKRAWATIDDKPVLGPAPLSSETIRGRVGFASQDGGANFTELKISQIPSYYIVAETFTGLQQTLQDEMHALLPLWFKEGQAPEMGAARIKDTLIAASRGVAVIPVIEAGQNTSPGESDLFADRVFKALANPLVKPLISTIAVRNPDEKLLSLIRAKGYKIIRIVSPDMALKVRPNTDNIGNDDTLLIEANPTLPASTLEKLLRTYPADRLIAPVDEATGVPGGTGVVRFIKR